jgi:hypothetical protein
MHDVNNIEEELRRKQAHAAQVAYEDDDGRSLKSSVRATVSTISHLGTS